METRYRQTASTKSTASPPTPAQEQNPAKSLTNGSPTASSSGFSILDILRIVAGILILSSGMSYLSSSGASMTWGYNPWWTRAREWKALWQGGVFLTDDELRAYDGTDPSKPIYIALNGTIYDVSASPKTYGPGGSYHFFSGRDAARAFLTGCFKEDQTPDLRGVEMMYIPVDPPIESADKDSADAEADKKAGSQDKRRKPLSKGELKNRRAQELRAAKKQVKEGLEHWHQLFRGDKGKPYFKVGEVKREPGWLEKLPKRTLCENAEKNRPVRKEDE